ncbi:MAG TPA: YHS domain-containing (seleno)protein [Pseudolabrys sp.]|nr:YHS domain-containing (seleno)protein [Pseudolabrys sp.]
MVALRPALAATTELIVTDPTSGLAISGFDPVSYFTDPKPEIGAGTLEFGYAKVIWRFANEGNRAAFKEHPEVYMPRFGGYDPVAIVRGVTVPGHPLNYLVVGQRLYLFYDSASHAAFAKDPERFIEAADRKWPEVSKELTP